jgi:hypothetical protein
MSVYNESYPEKEFDEVITQVTSEEIPAYEYNPLNKTPLVQIDNKSAAANTSTPTSNNLKSGLFKRSRSDQENEEDLFLTNTHFGKEQTPK